MKVTSLDGPVSNVETGSLLDYISTMQPAASNEKNAWSYGTSGQAVRALGLIDQMGSGSQIAPSQLADQMVRFCDAQLAERNDLAPEPIGQHMIWTNRIDPAWPNDLSKPKLSTGGEQGDMIGNLGNCAVTILHTRSLWNKTVPAGDPHHFGATYLDRAKTYVKQADFAIDHHILNGLLDLSHGNHQYFAAGSPYKGGTPIPWNQVMMFNYGFQMLSSAHTLLHDDAARATRYHQIVADNIPWFFTEGVQNVTTRQGRSAYNWAYALPARGGEDCTHARMDVAGLYLSYLEGSYPVTRDEMTRLANTFTDIITLAPGSYSGRVDGTSGNTAHTAAIDNVKNGFLFLAEFRPDAYQQIVSQAVTVGSTAAATEGSTTGDTDLFARFLWAKHRHNQHSR
ncbi:hypothetical protein JAO29_08785 [Edaphobacter sp. HDX4]|uniref:hypothetical protein n=1 Tax=Edaphobacter sp. HDX4 TaxID=2794064 RepID=UPI002FE67530